MTLYRLTMRRTDLVTFEVEADSIDDAVARCWTHGEELGTVPIVVGQPELVGYETVEPGEEIAENETPRPLSVPAIDRARA